MASISITVPDTLVPRVVAAMRAAFPDYAADTDAAAFKAVTAQFWKDIVVSYESERAAGAAKLAQLATSTNDVSVIA